MRKKVAIIGGGAAAITCAAFLDKHKFDVTIYEKNKALGRKFLVAGKGGFNLTHSEEISELIERYTPTDFLESVLQNFDNDDLRNWLESIGISTYIGSSKRVYPTIGTKPIEVLKAIQNDLEEKGVKIEFGKAWIGWDLNENLIFKPTSTLETDLTIFALGGSSWKVTGSDGSWTKAFGMKNITVNPFQASNCSYHIHWDKKFIQKYAGSPLKNIAIRCLKKKQKGEVVITENGLEGNAVYALSPAIRSELKSKGHALISIDLKPTLSVNDIVEKLDNSKAKNISAALKNDVKLSAVHIGLLKTYVSKASFLDYQLLSQKIKNLELTITKAGEIDEAISTVGGLSLAELDNNYQLNSIKNTYCIGEMLDWDAPTGGYLLQACFSMGVGLAQHLNNQ